MSKKKAMFATDKEGRAYVDLQMVMHFMVALFDGLPVTYFPPSKRPWLELDVAEAWVRKEMGERVLASDIEHYELMLKVFDKFRRQEATDATLARQLPSRRQEEVGSESPAAGCD